MGVAENTTQKQKNPAEAGFFNWVPIIILNDLAVLALSLSIIRNVSASWLRPCSSSLISIFPILSLIVFLTIAFPGNPCQLPYYRFPVDSFPFLLQNPSLPF